MITKLKPVKRSSILHWGTTIIGKDILPYIIANKKMDEDDIEELHSDTGAILIVSITRMHDKWETKDGKRYMYVCKEEELILKKEKKVV